MCTETSHQSNHAAEREENRVHLSPNSHFPPSLCDVARCRQTQKPQSDGDVRSLARGEIHLRKSSLASPRGSRCREMAAVLRSELAAAECSRRAGKSEVR